MRLHDNVGLNTKESGGRSHGCVRLVLAPGSAMNSADCQLNSAAVACGLDVLNMIEVAAETDASPGPGSCFDARGN